MKIAMTAICLIGLFLSSQIYAAGMAKDYDPAEVRCRWAGDDMIATLLSQVDFADQALPNIPPEEQHYLEAEFAAAGRTYKNEVDSGNKNFSRSTQMYLRLYARPMYPVWALRKTIEPARAALKRILKRQPQPERGNADLDTYKKNPEAEKLERATSALAAVGEYVSALQAFLDNTRGRELSLLTRQQMMRLLVSRYSMLSDMGGFMSCKLAKIMGRQSFQ